jgi:hypothetical protein
VVVAVSFHQPMVPARVKVVVGLEGALSCATADVPGAAGYSVQGVLGTGAR